MEKLRKDIEDIYKWNLTDLIKDDEEYQELVTKSYMLIGKIKRFCKWFTEGRPSVPWFPRH